MLDNHLLAYLITTLFIGSIPTGYIAARLMGKESIFPPGERSPKNPGDVFRILGRGVGLLVTFIDFSKGYLAVSFLVTFFLGKTGQLDWRIVSAGATLTILGHVSSPWLGFRGGRGFATSFGVMLHVLPIPTLLSGILWMSLAFWGLSTRPGILSFASAMPLFSLVYIVFFDFDHLFYLYLVAFISLLTMFEYRLPLKQYMGIPISSSPPPAPPSAPHPEV
jgi:glycerol-3-phosphate acyltransferase PlsY